MAVGVLWLMTNKPGWAESLGVVGGLTLAGAVAGTVATRRGAAG
jgi:hypothetical protein